MKTCGQCKSYGDGKQTCVWRPAGKRPMWLLRGFANDFNPWISPTTDASKCECFELRDAAECEGAR